MPLNGCINDLLNEAKALRSIRLNYNGDWELTTHTILKKGHVRHLSLDNGQLSRSACVNIRNLLTDHQQLSSYS